MTERRNLECLVVGSPGEQRPAESVQFARPRTSNATSQLEYVTVYLATVAPENTFPYDVLEGSFKFLNNLQEIKRPPLDTVIVNSSNGFGEVTPASEVQYNFKVKFRGSVRARFWMQPNEWNQLHVNTLQRTFVEVIVGDKLVIHKDDAVGEVTLTRS